MTMIALAPAPGFKHGHYVGGEQSPTYRCWRAMLTRCLNPKAPQSKYYFHEGVKVCRRWRRFENFLADMGERPSLEHSLDRFPVRDGNYNPDNVRWATMEQQNRGRRNCRPVVRSDGVRHPTIVEAAEAVRGDAAIIRSLCDGRRKTPHAGFTWSFAP